MTISYYFIPLISALVGWITNYISIRMLFRPGKPKKFFFIKFHGIIPKRLPQLAERLGIIISETLLTKDILKRQLDGTNVEDLEDIVNEKVRTSVDKLLDQHKMIRAFLSESVINDITSTLTTKISEALSSILDTFGDRMLDTVDFKSLISKQIGVLDPKTIEKRVVFILKNEFKFIEKLGGVLGFVVGLIQFFVLYCESKPL